MSKKKKRGPAPRSVGGPNAQSAQLSNYTSKEKKMDPTARNLLLCNLIFLVVCQLCYDQKLISEGFASICSIIGIILMVVALWLQFRSKKDQGSSGGSSLLK